MINSELRNLYAPRYIFNFEPRNICLGWLLYRLFNSRYDPWVPLSPLPHLIFFSVYPRQGDWLSLSGPREKYRWTESTSRWTNGTELIHDPSYCLVYRRNLVLLCIMYKKHIFLRWFHFKRYNFSLGIMRFTFI